MDGQFDIDSFNLSTDEGNGELVFSRNDEKKIEIDAQEPVVETKPDDKFAVMETTISNLMANSQKQSNAIGILIKAILDREQQPQQQNLNEEALGELFTDTEKGKDLIGVITNTIEQVIDKRFGQLQPIVNQNKVQAEWQHLQANAPDLPQYLMGMKYVTDINPTLTLVEAYQKAKELGWRQELKQPENKGVQKDNVVDINQPKKIPGKIDSSNAQLKSREVTSVRDALEMALEELGA